MNDDTALGSTSSVNNLQRIPVPGHFLFEDQADPDFVQGERAGGLRRRPTLLNVCSSWIVVELPHADSGMNRATENNRAILWE